MANPGGQSDWLNWMKRILAGDADAETELVSRYKDGIGIIINRVVHSKAVTEDLSQETFRIALEKIRDGQVREPERLSGFITGIARNLALDHMRRTRGLMSQEDVSHTERIRDPQPGPFEQLWRKERAELMHRLMGELKIERDREVLTRYYVAEEPKEQICADLGLTSQQFNTILSRALKRYKELYIKRFGGGP